MKKIIIIIFFVLFVSINTISGCKKTESESGKFADSVENKEIPKYISGLKEVYAKMYTKEYSEAYCYYNHEESNAYIVLLQRGAITGIVENILVLRKDGTTNQFSLSGYISTGTQDISVRGISNGEIKIAVNNQDATNVYAFAIEDAVEGEDKYKGSLYNSFPFDNTVDDFGNKISEIEWMK